MNAPTRTVLSLKRPQEGDTVLEERLHKVLATAGLGSRRLLETRIEAGEVKVNGSAAGLGSSLRPGDRVELDGKLFVAVTDTNENAEVLIYHKPEGVVTTRDDPEGRPTVFEQLPRLKGARWITIGRLDINTTGLLLLTTDGALAHALMHPGTEIPREYICRVHGEVPDEVLEKLQSGVELDDGPARFEEIGVISRGESHSWFRIVLREGRNREVRRMWESQGLMVSRLKRTRYGNVELPRLLRKGGCETLEPEQVKALRQLAGATAATPVLTLQPVINQRRVRPGNEFRPEPRTQQAWTGTYHDEGRELRAFDRIRDDAPTRPANRFNNAKRGPGGAPRGNGGPGSRRPIGAGPRRGPAPGHRPRSGQEQNPWNAGGNSANRAPGRGNAHPNNRGPAQRRGPQDSAGFQPRTWFPSPENGFSPPTGPRQGKGPRPGQGNGQARRDTPYGGGNADRPQRSGGQRGPANGNAAPRGNGAPRDFSAPRGNTGPSPNRGDRRGPTTAGAGRPGQRSGNGAPGNARADFRGGNGQRGNAHNGNGAGNGGGRHDGYRGPIDDNIGNRATPDNSSPQRRRGPPRRPG